MSLLLKFIFLKAQWSGFEAQTVLTSYHTLVSQMLRIVKVPR